MTRVDRSIPATQLPGGIVAVPTSPADVVAFTTFLFQISVANTTASPITFTVKDKQTVPLNIIPTQSIAANVTVVFSWPEGLKCLGGVNWTSGGAGLQAEVFGVYGVQTT